MLLHVNRPLSVVSVEIGIWYQGIPQKLHKLLLNVKTPIDTPSKTIQKSYACRPRSVGSVESVLVPRNSTETTEIVTEW